eukprot:2032180-Prymnesium_polylepis.1
MLSSDPPERPSETAQPLYVTRRYGRSGSRERGTGRDACSVQLPGCCSTRDSSVADRHKHDWTAAHDPPT